MTGNPIFEITSDTTAAIVKGEARFELSGPHAARIIAVYRHQQTHGDAIAATYLMGIIDGLAYSHWEGMRQLLDKPKTDAAAIERAARAIAVEECRRIGMLTKPTPDMNQGDLEYWHWLRSLEVAEVFEQFGDRYRAFARAALKAAIEPEQTKTDS